jgi:hypothetical protein
LFVLLFFSVGHFIVFPSSIYGFWLSLWCFQTFLIDVLICVCLMCCFALYLFMLVCVTSNKAFLFLCFFFVCVCHIHHRTSSLKVAFYIQITVTGIYIYTYLLFNMYIKIIIIYNIFNMFYSNKHLHIIIGYESWSISPTRMLTRQFFSFIFCKES